MAAKLLFAFRSERGTNLPPISTRRTFEARSTNFHRHHHGTSNFLVPAAALSSPTFDGRTLYSALFSSNAATWLSKEGIAAASDPSSTTTFEPVLSIPALVTFLFITVIFSALFLRTSQVEEAVQDRNSNLKKLRDLKTRQLAGDASVSPQDIKAVLQQYERSLQREEELRNVIPGAVRIVPPSAGNQKEEEASLVAKQLLGRDFDVGTPKRERNESGQLSAVAVGVLVAVGMLLVGLLAFLSLMYLR